MMSIFEYSYFIPFQVERNLHDAMNVARNVITDPRLVPGGGACEMALAHVSTHIIH